MILESRNNNNPSSKRNNMMSNNNSAAVNNSSYADNYHTENKKLETNTNTPKSIFDDILKPKENVKRETTTMKPASSTTFSSRPPQSYNNTNQYKSSDVYLKNNNIEANKNIEQNNDTVNNHRTSLNNTLKREENNSYDMNAQDRKDIIRSSIYTMTNSLDKPNIDYNRVINDMVNPNNNNIIKREENIKKIMLLKMKIL